MSRLLLVRHGDTKFTSARRFQGYSDIDLSAAGYKQAERLHDRLAMEKIDIIYSSDLRRALATDEAIAARQQAHIMVCTELREINYGEIEGLTFDEISCSYPEVASSCVDWSLQLNFPGGESFEEFSQRVRGFPSRLKKHAPEQTILIVAHGGPLRVLLCYLCGVDLWHWRQFQINVASLSIVETYPEIAVISLLNDTSHLR